MTDDEREVPLELPKGLAHGLDEIALVVALDKVDDGLGVCLGGEDVALGLEGLLELAVVLDDPVEDDGEKAPRANRSEDGHSRQTRPWVAQRVCPMPVVALEPFGGLGAQVAQVSDGSNGFERAAVQEAETGGVVAAVLEPLKALHEQILCAPPADISDDPAHPKLPSPSLRQPCRYRQGGLRTSG